jgi:hypothetical protein
MRRGAWIDLDDGSPPLSIVGAREGVACRVHVDARAVSGRRTAFRDAAHVTGRHVCGTVDAASESSMLAMMAFALLAVAAILSLADATSLFFR